METQTDRNLRPMWFAVFFAVGLSLVAFVLAVISLSVPREAATGVGSAMTVSHQGAVRPKVDLSKATRLSHGVYDLGYKMIPGTTKKVQGLAIIHHSPNSKEHLSSMEKFSMVQSNSETCYVFLATGAVWKQQANWYLNANNNQGLSSTFLFNAFEAAITQWDNVLTTFKPLGSGSLTNSLTVSVTSPDGNNVVSFGQIDQPGVLAVTYTVILRQDKLIMSSGGYLTDPLSIERNFFNTLSSNGFRSLNLI